MTVDNVVKVFEVGDEMSQADRTASTHAPSTILGNDRRRIVGLFKDEPAL